MNCYEIQGQRSGNKDKPKITITRVPTIDQSSLEFLYPLPPEAFSTRHTCGLSNNNNEPNDNDGVSDDDDDEEEEENDVVLVDGDVVVHVTADRDVTSDKEHYGDDPIFI